MSAAVTVKGYTYPHLNYYLVILPRDRSMHIEEGPIVGPSWQREVQFGDVNSCGQAFSVLVVSTRERLKVGQVFAEDRNLLQTIAEAHVERDPCK